MKKVLKIAGITLSAIVLLLFITPYLMPKTISRAVEKWVNGNIKGEVRFEDSSLSFFRHFPSLTLSLHNFTLKGSAPFQQDTLLYTKELAFRVDLSTVFSNEIKIDQVFINEANINVKVDEKGNANYNVYESKPDTTQQVTESSNTAIKIEGIFIKKSNLSYNDQSVPMLISAKGLNYSGQGDFSKAIFDLKSQANIDSLDVVYAGSPYLLGKKINAKLLTKINTNSLDLMFDENDLQINSLPIHFVGRFSFIKDGYDINFKTKAKETDLHNIFSALPAAIASRVEKTNIKGYAEIEASLIGKYLVKSNTMPTATFNMKIRDGQISNPKAPESISKLYLNLQTRLPSLNMDSLTVNMDSLYFNMGKDYVSSVVKLNGLVTPEIYIKTHASIDLEKWGKIFSVDLIRGHYDFDLHADGRYTKKVVRSGIRKVDTVIATIPKFQLTSKVSNGYFKFASLPAAIDKINFSINGSNPDGDYKNTKLDISNINIQALSSYIRGSAKLQTAENMPVDVQLKSMVNFAEIKNFYPLKDLELNGELHVDLQSKGGYNKLKKLFPVTTASIQLANGRIKTAHFDQALEQIVIDADLVNRDGKLKGTQLNIKPISFQMAGQPFMLKADVKNFENVAYNISSKGTIDIGKMYQLFAVKGYQVKGSIFTNVSFKGLQSDAMNGRYHKLNNRGRVVVKSLNLESDMFPKTFLIKNGVFSFAQDKMKFENFQASYGKSNISLKGHLGNVINYALSDKAKLTGNFTMQTKALYADEFMAYNGVPVEATGKPIASNGVIIIPDNLNVEVNANAGTVYYNDLKIKDAKGTLALNNGVMSLKQASFNMIDAPVLMDATYKSLSPKSATFDYHLSAKEFDIAKAYKEIKLFRELATSAGKMKGVIGLDYQLSGKLNQDMFPVFPSLKGGGVLSLKKISMSGFKLMNAVGKATRRDSLSNPDLSEVNIKTTINNNIITIERFKMRVAGFRPRFEGQVSFDGRLNLSGRLGLPPFGLIGIPLSITGTQDKPKVALKRNKDAKLEETEDEGA
ncbi:AsmA family protein [Pedobacter sp. PLR]|uniref:AsmA family protein n=1 Tax=Pedobacter sp. PLR TaxID=2994465 RepID=UPI0022485BF3|nr:AsmA family protein [Pedobacter sp. PLR]MCX2454136.1 AsmA family protein [Pedobacter sp. PLR]